MRPLLAIIAVLTCVTALPRRSVAQIFLPIRHEVLRGYLLPNVTLTNGPPQITFRLTIDPNFPASSPQVTGSLRCRTVGTPACLGRQGAVSNVSVSQRVDSPREASLANFDADVTFVPEGVSCHFLGVTPRFAILLEFISGSYTCTATSGSVVQTGTFGATRRRA